MIRGNERAIDLGLSVLAAVSPPGRRHTLDELADVCEEARNVLKCSPHPITRQDFWFLEHRALQKLQRAAIRRMRALRSEIETPLVPRYPTHRVNRERIAA
jgi:hypothetical protein